MGFRILEEPTKNTLDFLDVTLGEWINFEKKEKGYMNPEYCYFITYNINQ